MKMKKWSSQWTKFMQLRKEVWKKFGTSTWFEPVTSRFTGAMLYQLSYEATDVGSRSPPSLPIFFSGFFTHLHKLRSLRRSFLHFDNATLLLTFHFSVNYYFFDQLSVNYCFFLAKYQLIANPIGILNYDLPHYSLFFYKSHVRYCSLPRHNVFLFAMSTT